MIADFLCSWPLVIRIRGIKDIVLSSSPIQEIIKDGEEAINNTLTTTVATNNKLAGDKNIIEKICRDIINLTFS